MITNTRSIIGSINDGAIPSIDSTWNMMCKIETNKALELAEKIYDDYIKEKYDSESIKENNLYVYLTLLRYYIKRLRRNV